MSLCNAAGEHEVEPVGIDPAVPILVDHGLGDGTGFLHEIDVLAGIHRPRVHSEFLNRITAVIEYPSRPLLAGLSGDDDHAVTGLSTVDGGGSGILEDLYALDVLRIHGAEAGNLKAVHDIERIACGTGIR